MTAGRNGVGDPIASTEDVVTYDVHAAVGSASILSIQMAN